MFKKCATVRHCAPLYAIRHCGTRNLVSEEDQGPCQICNQEVQESGAPSDEIEEISLHSDSLDSSVSSVFGAEQGPDCSYSSNDDSHLSVSLPLSDNLSDDTPWPLSWFAENFADVGNMPSEPACAAATVQMLRGNVYHTRGSQSRTGFLETSFLVTF